MTLSYSMLSHFSLPLILSSRNPIPLFLSSIKVLPWITRSMPVFTGISRHGWSTVTLLVTRTTPWILLLWASIIVILLQGRYPCLIYSNHSPLFNQRLLRPLPPCRVLCLPLPCRALCLPLPHHTFCLTQRLLVSPHFFHSSQTLTQSNRAQAIFANSKTPWNFWWL